MCNSLAIVFCVSELFEGILRFVFFLFEKARTQALSFSKYFFVVGGLFKNESYIKFVFVRI